MKIKKIIILVMVLMISLTAIHSLYAKTRKEKKMEDKIKQQQDTIDLLQLKLKQANLGTDQLSGKPSSGNYVHPPYRKSGEPEGIFYP